MTPPDTNYPSNSSEEPKSSGILAPSLLDKTPTTTTLLPPPTELKTSLSAKPTSSGRAPALGWYKYLRTGGNGGDQVPTEEGFIQDPYDDWSARDLLLSLIPLVITYGLKDIDLPAGLVIATVLSWTLLLLRVIWWDSRKKRIWPLLDIISVVYFPILLGLTQGSNQRYWELVKWWPVMSPSVFASSALLSMAILRPFTAHYARFSKSGPGGYDLWMRDGTWRAYSYLATGLWVFAFGSMALLSLIPVMTGMFSDYDALNIVFDYIVPGIILLAALAGQGVLGKLYRDRAESSKQVEEHAMQTAGPSSTTDGGLPTDDPRMPAV